MYDIMINLRQIENDTRKIYENSFELSLLEEQLEDMLTAIDKNNMEFERGNISKTAFKSNETKLKKNSVKLIKSIKEIISNNLNLLKSIEDDVENQATERGQKRAKKRKMLKQISKRKKKVVDSGSD